MMRQKARLMNRHRLPLALVLASSLLMWDVTNGMGQTIRQQGGTTGADTPKLRYQTPWFNDPDVRAQIKMNDNQYTRLNEYYGRYWQRYQDRLKTLDEETDEKERLNRAAQMEEEFDQDFTRSLDTIITDERSRKRYEQLYRQYAGYSAFHDPKLRKELDLTSEQLAQLKTYDREWNEEVAEIREEFEKDRPSAMRSLKHARRRMNDRILDTLTPEQQATWKVLTGDVYDFPAQTYFPPTQRRNVERSDRSDTATPPPPPPKN